MGGVVNEVAPSVAVKIDGVFEIGRRHELGGADFSRPGAAHLRRRHVATLNNSQGVHQLRAESDRIGGSRRPASPMR